MAQQKISSADIGSVANTAITGNIISSQITSVANTQLTGVVTSNQLAPTAQYMGFKNRIINGDMRIDQRNAGASVTPGVGTVTYTVDRWNGYQNQASKFTVQQNAGSVTPPVGFKNYLGATSSSAYTTSGTDEFDIAQYIEGYNVADLSWGTSDAKTVTLSAWVRSSLIGTFGGAISNSNSTRSYPFSYSIPVANTWTQISVIVPGDTTGTWNTTTGLGMLVNFSLGAGATRSGTVNTWAGANYTQPASSVSVVGTNGATFYITGVQLEVGSQATSFDFRDYGRELIMCQRYYIKWSMPVSTGGGAGMGVAVSGTLSDIQLIMPVGFRTSSPGSITVDATALSVYVVPTQTSYSGGTWGIGYTTNTQVLPLRYTHGTSVFTLGQVTYPAGTGSTSYLALSGEL